MKDKPARISILVMIAREMRRSKANTALCFFTVFVAAAAIVAMTAVSRASVDATRVMMKRMGFNVLITPEGVDPARFQALDFQNEYMPEDYVDRLAASTVLAQHFVGKLQRTIEVDGLTVVLTGVRAEVPRHDRYRKPMPTAYVVPEGEVYLGAAAAEALQAEKGDALEILGESFTVGAVLEETGAMPEDIRVFSNLKDVQRLLGKPDEINAIDALSCYCPVEVDDVLGALEESVYEVLPDVNVKAYKSILLARQNQRQMMFRVQAAVLALIAAASATAIWGLTYHNAANRTREIGVLYALGVPLPKIAGLFAGKIVAYSLPAAALGCVAGQIIAVAAPVADRVLTAPYGLIAALIAGAPLASLLFGLPPIYSVVSRDPAASLGDATG